MQKIDVEATCAEVKKQLEGFAAKPDVDPSGLCYSPLAIDATVALFRWQLSLQADEAGTYSLIDVIKAAAIIVSTPLGNLIYTAPGDRDQQHSALHYLLSCIDRSTHEIVMTHSDATKEREDWVDLTMVQEEGDDAETRH